MEKHNLKMLRLARSIQSHFPEFYLAGGTAIMLRYTHRVSMDLDFMRYKSFSFTRLLQKVQRFFRISTFIRGDDNIDIFIEDMKVSFVHFPFKNIEPLYKFKGIKMASNYDIFLNKIYAAGRRIETKDPIDAAFLYNLHHWSKQKIKKDFERKFSGQSYEIFLGALLNFEDYPDLPESVKQILVKLVE